MQQVAAVPCRKRSGQWESPLSGLSAACMWGIHGTPAQPDPVLEEPPMPSLAVPHDGVVPDNTPLKPFTTILVHPHNYTMCTINLKL